MSNEDIKPLLALDVDSLFQEIGSILTEEQVSATPPDKNELLERGTKWWNYQLDNMKKKICPRSKELIELQKNDEYQFVLTVADIVAGATIGIPPFLVGTLMLKIGLKKVCEETT